MSKLSVTEKDEIFAKLKDKPSQKLMEFLEITGLVPFDVVLPEISEEVRKSIHGYIRQKNPKIFVLFWKEIFEQIKGYSDLVDYLNLLSTDKFIKFEKNGVSNVEFVEKSKRGTVPNCPIVLLKEYDKVVQVRKKVIYIAYNITFLLPFEFENMKPSLPYGYELLQMPDFTPYFALYDKKICISPDSVLGSISNLNLTRLRICRICRKVYWAYRLDAQTCSQKCAQTYRTRKWRENQKNRFKSRVKN